MIGNKARLFLFHDPILRQIKVGLFIVMPILPSMARCAIIREMPTTHSDTLDGPSALLNPNIPLPFERSILLRPAKS